MKELRNIRMTILSKKDSNDITPNTVEIYYRVIDQDAGLASDRMIKKEVDEMDITKSIADLWNECIEEIS